MGTQKNRLNETCAQNTDGQENNLNFTLKFYIFMLIWPYEGGSGGGGGGIVQKPH